MPSNDWSSREPPSLGPIPSGGHGGSPESRLPSGALHPEPRGRRYRAPLEEYNYPVERAGGIGRKLVYAFLVLVALLAIGLGALLVAPPVDLVRSHVVAEVERQTGRRLTIGSAGVSFASGLGVSLDDVALSAPPGMEGPPLLTAERIEVSLALLPLVTRELRVERLTMVKPVLHLRVDRSGRRSWHFAGAGDTMPRRPLRYAEAPAPATDAGGLPPEVTDFMRNASPLRHSASGGLDALALSDVRILGGTLRYADDRSALSHEVTGMDATVSFPSVDGPLTMEGEVVLEGEREVVKLQLNDVRGFLADRAVSMRASARGKVVNASFDGRISTGAKPLKEGKLALEAPSASALFRALGLPVIGADAIGPVSLDGQLRATDESLMLTSATLAAGQSSGTGTLGLETSGQRPRLIANMQLAALHLDPLLSVRRDDSAAPPAAPPSEASSPGRFAVPGATRMPSAAPPRSIGDLLKRDDAAPAATSPAARVKGFRQRLGNQWEVDAIDVASLRTIDIEGRFQIASLHTEKLTVESLQTGVELNDGVLRITVADGRIAGGAVRGLASVDARQSPMTVGANISGDNVGLKPLLDLAGIDLIDGKGRLIVALSAKGTSERELVSTLAGRAEIKVTEGALVGWDADAIVAEVGRGRMPHTERRHDARTPFKELSGNFQIAQGVARSKDLKLDSETVTASGTATVNIVDRNLDIVLKPKVASGGIEVPVRIAGPWGAPNLVADVAGVLKSPQAQEAVKNLKDGNVDGALRSVLGNGPKAEKKINKAKELLRGLLDR